ncbi:hypothetical protein RJ639_039934 [Escallonia herrerae]|uniref:Uncharacterized protein n=1 Tax=Escallonia herrerae TaxID=1293975 RepID=A0AA88WYM9_9ASTE|nr:hypothetical protein RJ639_025807 [Escallonia herrerae]KAK3028925.1 hypothetical protein RJ639_039934 [Escallonia herrerae]
MNDIGDMVIHRVLPLVETYEALKLQDGCDASEIVSINNVSGMQIPPQSTPAAPDVLQSVQSQYVLSAISHFLYIFLFAIFTAGFDHGAFELMQEKVIAESYNLMKSAKDAHISYILLCNSHPIKDVFDVHRLDLQSLNLSTEFLLQLDQYSATNLEKKESVSISLEDNYPSSFTCPGERVHVGSNTAPEKSRLLRNDTEFHPQILKTYRADVKSIYKNSPPTGFHQSKQSRY